MNFLSTLVCNRQRVKIYVFLLWNIKSGLFLMLKSTEYTSSFGRYLWIVSELRILNKYSQADDAFRVLLQCQQNDSRSQACCIGIMFYEFTSCVYIGAARTFASINLGGFLLKIHHTNKSFKANTSNSPHAGTWFERRQQQLQPHCLQLQYTHHLAQN